MGAAMLFAEEKSQSSGGLDGMKVVRLACLFFLLLVFAACNQQVHWLSIPNAPDRGNLGQHDDIFALNALHAWVVNTSGQVFRTTDGWANSSLIADNQSIQFRAVGFASSEVGWAGNLNRLLRPARDSALWETRDGGKTWANIDHRVTGPRPVGVCGIWVLDQQNIFAVGRWPGSAIFMRSIDGGQTWVSKDLAPLASTLIDVFFFDNLTGIVVGGEGGDVPQDGQSRITTTFPNRAVVLRTDDGGVTWRQVYMGGSGRRNWAWKISFPSQQIGYVSLEGWEGVVLKTKNGGQTWNELRTGIEDGLRGVGFISPDTGWASSYTTTYATTNGGVTWTETAFGSGINRFRFLSGANGYAVGKTVYHYSRWADRYAASQTGR